MFGRNKDIAAVILVILIVFLTKHGICVSFWLHVDNYKHWLNPNMKSVPCVTSFRWLQALRLPKDAVHVIVTTIKLL